MAAHAHVEPALHVSVTQFAKREGVSRIRVLQLLAERRIPSARKIGHHWIIPGTAAIVRRGNDRASARPRFVYAGRL